MADTDQMSPDSSPGASSKKTGVRRVNNVPLMIGIAVLALFMGLIAMVAVKRSNQANVEHAATTQGKGGDSSLMAADIVGGRADGLIAEAKTEPPLLPPADPQAPTAPNGVSVARVDNPNAPPQPPRGNGGQRSPEDQEDEQLRQRKMQLFQTAVGAKTAITLPDMSRVGTGTTADAPQTPDEMVDRIAQVRRQIDQQRATDPNAAYQAQLRQVQGNIGSGGSGGGMGGGRSGGSSGMMLASSSSDTGKDYSTFDGKGKKDRWALDSKMEAPTTPFEIRAGAVIPGIMLSGINSDLPGQIMAQVSQDVYDTATGKYLLIPQGTRMVGTYSSDVAFGQEGVLIAWQRLVFPDGKALDIGAMPGADMAGYSGFRDKVNHHLWRVYGSALFMAGITAGASMATDQGNSNSFGDQQPSVSSELSSALGQQLGQVSAQIISKNLNIAPTIEIRPGYRFNIVAVKDVTFTKAYQSFDY
ncbi:MULTISPECIES: TrbI/VirB10 family protein [Pseudomonas]|uniref:TrbI/VirB10 family protein n=2 Tax=Pseudomonas TaxID=286 RepID=A0ABT4WY47_PSEFR|nr:TrbI/VirB10 family protein [Pseudomonas fragi]MDA7024850.1 TrbI/VirB10 family protein [Pseudomonas fragi]